MTAALRCAHGLAYDEWCAGCPSASTMRCPRCAASGCQQCEGTGLVDRQSLVA